MVKWIIGALLLIAFVRIVLSIFPGTENEEREDAANDKIVEDLRLRNEGK